MSRRAAPRGARIRAAVLLLALLSIVWPLAGCGSSKPHNPFELRLELTDLVLISQRLQRAEGPIEGELRGARAAWPSLYEGMPSTISRQLERSISTASRKASRLIVPLFFGKAHELTGPASGIGALYETFFSLSRQGWKAIEATSSSIRRGPASLASFRRANVPIYIQSVYDAHYDLSLIGKDLQSGYEKLGGGEIFGRTLTPSEVEALARFYTPELVRLEPHPARDLRR